MATQKEKAAEKVTARAAQTIVLDAQAHAAQRLAAEIQDQRDAGIVPDKTIPGGRYKSPDGSWHDAHGNRLDLDEDGEPKKAARGADKTPGTAEEIDAEIRELEQRRTQLLSQRQVVGAREEAEQRTADAERQQQLAAGTAPEVGAGSGAGSTRSGRKTGARKTARKSGADK